MEQNRGDTTARQRKPIRFTGTAEGNHTGSNHKSALDVFNREVVKLIESTPELSARQIGAVEWKLWDAASNEVEGEDPVELLEEFETHGLAPQRLFRHQMNRVKEDPDQYYQFTSWYRISGSISLEITGPNRIVVDGLKASFDRIVEKVVDAAAQPERAAETRPQNLDTPSQLVGSSAVVAEGSAGWWRRTWRDHTIAAGSTLTTGVVLAGVIYYLNWN
ncbi:hypothetical protein E8P82_04595 [Arthrobacter echini]|uniref:Uncharacterized protein n=1 Tax=Arthrobacter echini TaxID=1529066 RepID=A0A4S5E7C9_9MICC|nr:hypothetical protein [Arthrobacter echini]THJ67390.1 hypothetical protein E8P82_04595 [Arthrobacter echini]